MFDYKFKNQGILFSCYLVFTQMARFTNFFFLFPIFFFFLVYTFFLNKIAIFTALVFSYDLIPIFSFFTAFFSFNIPIFSLLTAFFFSINGSHFIFYHLYIYIYITETFEAPTIFHIIILIYKKNLIFKLNRKYYMKPLTNPTIAYKFFVKHENISLPKKY